MLVLASYLLLLLNLAVSTRPARIRGDRQPRVHHRSECDYSKLGFTFDENNALPLERLRAIDDPLKRARASKPSALRETRKRQGSGYVWASTDHTNFEYVNKRLQRWRDKTKRDHERQKAERDQLIAETGEHQILQRSKLYRARFDRARLGSPDAEMKFSKGNTRGARQTKAQWLARTRMTKNKAETRRKHARKRQSESGQGEGGHVDSDKHRRGKPNDFRIPDLNLPAVEESE